MGKDSDGPKPEAKAESTRPIEAEVSTPKTGDNVAPTPKAPVSIFDINSNGKL